MPYPLFFHVDIDAFYASVEVLDFPQYKGKPLVVGGLGRRGVVSTCSYEARDMGVSSGMSMLEAKRKAPQAVFLPTRMSRYREKSNELMNILRNYTPSFLQMSIDEAFIDVTGMERLIGSPIVLANKIKSEVIDKTGLKVSIGGGCNKYIAKMASSLSKPDGLLIVPPDTEGAFMKNISLKKLWGVGKKGLAKLNSKNICSVEDILKYSREELISIFGRSFGVFLYNVARGRDEGVFKERCEIKSISREHTFEYDTKDLNVIDNLIFEEAEKILKELVKKNLHAKTVMLKICYDDFSKKQYMDTGEPIYDTIDLYKKAKHLFLSYHDENKKIRLLGIGLTNLYSSTPPLQKCLFMEEEHNKKRNAERLMRDLQEKGMDIAYARLLNSDEKN